MKAICTRLLKHFEIGVAILSASYGLFLCLFHRFQPFMLVWFLIAGLALLFSCLKKKWIFRSLTLLFCLLGCLLIGLPYALKPDQNIQNIVVLGGGLVDTEPSLMLQDRLDVAAELQLAHSQSQLYCAGGQGPDELLPEGLAMARYLQKHYSLESVAEKASFNTYENLKNVLALSPKIASEKTVIVSSNFHVLRAVMMARRLGYQDVHMQAVPVQFWLLPHYVLREMAAWCKALLAGQIF